jgi:MFS family permease
MKNKIYGLIVWLIVTLYVIYAFCLNTAGAVFAPSIKTALHINNVDVSYAIGAFIIGFAFMQIPAGFLLDKFNARYVVSAGILLLALGNILISFSNNLLLFSLSNFIQGIGGSFAFVAAGVLISAWFPAKLFPIFFGLTQTLSCVLSGILHYFFVYALQFISWNIGAVYNSL